METAAVLDVMEALLRAADHPDHVTVSRYGRDTRPGGQSPSGVKVTHQSGAASMLWAAVPHRDARPLPVPAVLPPPARRPDRILTLTHRLLDAADPDEFTSWEICATPGVGAWDDNTPPPSALRITCRDGSIAYLRTTAASGPNGAAGDPDTDPWPNYRIPEGIHSWHLKASAACAEPVSV